MAIERGWASRLHARLIAPVDIAALALFRVLFGAVLSVAAARFIAKGWVRELLLAPRYHFTYPYLEFVRPWPNLLMHAHLLVLTVCAVSLMLGYRSRTSAWLCALGFAYVELIERANYLNHYYLVCLVAGLLGCLPAGALLSIDALRRPELRAAAVPSWMLWVLRLQVGVVYVFAGVAKLNADWLLSAQPLRIWLAATDVSWLAHPACAYVASWAAAAFDILIVPALLFRRTRSFAFVLACAFHLTTAWLFPIGMFPWIMCICLSVFLPPDWPRVLIARWQPPTAAVARAPRAVPWVCGLHCLVQVAVPLHHHLCVRDSAWTQAGFDFAWKVMLVEKSGSVRFRLREPGATHSTITDPAELLEPFQLRALGQDPRLIISFARHLRREFQLRTGREIEVYVDAHATLNGRPMQRLMAADVDLTRETLPIHAILPLQ